MYRIGEGVMAPYGKPCLAGVITPVFDFEDGGEFEFPRMAGKQHLPRRVSSLVHGQLKDGYWCQGRHPRAGEQGFSAYVPWKVGIGVPAEVYAIAVCSGMAMETDQAKANIARVVRLP